MKPATALPWNRRVDPGPSMYAESVEGRTPKGKTITVARIASGAASRDKDAAYIVHAANNLPGLVEALQHIASGGESWKDCANVARVALSNAGIER